MALAPLSGFTIAVTADRRREEQVELLRRRGATVVEGPTVRTVPLVDDAGLRRAIADVVARPPDVTVFTTGVGTRGLVGAAESLGTDGPLLDALSSSLIVARGPKAIGAAVAAGLDVGWKAPGESSAEVLAHLTARAAAGERIAIQRDGDEVPVLADSLREAGADVVDIPVYRWSLPLDVAPAGRLVESLIAGNVDAVTFTSSPAVRNLVAVADDGGRGDELRTVLRDGVRVACVGPLCAGTARSLGVVDPIVPTRSRLGAMVQALVQGMAGSMQRLRLAGTEVSVQGGAAVIGGDEVRLTERERALLHALVGARGAVVAKRSLLRDVWGDECADEHTVEVTVARLRRRLGAAGGALETVPRRGYRLAISGTGLLGHSS
ncbi:MAG: uroporphyrinogen-III synthase [Acidobacteria bacterium]|nr:uroporphyrinogen-III synthase [Acidobacteriota bacterium]